MLDHYEIIQNFLTHFLPNSDFCGNKMLIFFGKFHPQYYLSMKMLIFFGEFHPQYISNS